MSDNLDPMARYFDLVPMEGDLVSILIRGHLIVEEQLNAALRSVSSNPEHIEKAGLKYGQLVHLVKAHYFKQKDSGIWGAVTKLNNVRNKYAHQLEPSDIDKLTNEFLDLVETDYSESETVEAKLHLAIAMVAACINHLYE